MKLQHTHLDAGLNIFVHDDDSITNLGDQNWDGSDNFGTPFPGTVRTLNGVLQVLDADGYIVCNAGTQFAMTAVRETENELVLALMPPEEGEEAVDHTQIELDIFDVAGHPTMVALIEENGHWLARVHVDQDQMVKIRARLHEQKLNVAYVPAGAGSHELHFGE